MSELLREIRYKIHGATWRDVWAWFMESHGIRLIPTFLLIWATGRLIYALVA